MSNVYYLVAIQNQKCNVFPLLKSNCGNADNANVLALHYELHSDTARNAVASESRLLEVPVFMYLSIVHFTFLNHNNILSQTIAI